MRVAVLVVLISGCADSEMVRVTDARTSSGAFSSTTSVEFFESDGSPAPSTQNMQTWVSTVGSGGSVSINRNLCGSPSSCSSSRDSLRGLQPGDDLVFDGQTSSLPPDCSITQVELVTVTGGSAWTDADSQAIDARIISLGSGVSGMPYSSNSGEMIIDSEATAFVPYQNRAGTGSSPPTTAAVSVVKCTDTDYHALRPLLTPSQSPNAIINSSNRRWFAAAG